MDGKEIRGWKDNQNIYVYEMSKNKINFKSEMRNLTSWHSKEWLIERLTTGQSPENKHQF